MTLNFNISEKPIDNQEFFVHSEFYSIIILQGEIEYSLDFSTYKTQGNAIIFLVPFQHFKVMKCDCSVLGKIISFKADFYCIEYHRNDVACNGILFNNLYNSQQVSLNNLQLQEINHILEQMQQENQDCDPYSASVLKTYLQLILAICSKEKKKQMDLEVHLSVNHREVVQFQDLLENHFITERQLSFYADKMGITQDNLAKKIKQETGKTPKQILQERIVLEAKKLLQLSDKSVKEIAAQLHFDDEYYFSRFFKKQVGIAPLSYRKDTAVGTDN